MPNYTVKMQNPEMGIWVDFMSTNSIDTANKTVAYYQRRNPEYRWAVHPGKPTKRKQDSGEGTTRAYHQRRDAR